MPCVQFFLTPLFSSGNYSGILWEWVEVRCVPTHIKHQKMPLYGARCHSIFFLRIPCYYGDATRFKLRINYYWKWMGCLFFQASRCTIQELTDSFPILFCSKHIWAITWHWFIYFFFKCQNFSGNFFFNLLIFPFSLWATVNSFCFGSPLNFAQ